MNADRIKQLREAADSDLLDLAEPEEMHALLDLYLAALSMRDYTVSGPHWFGEEYWGAFTAALERFEKAIA